LIKLVDDLSAQPTGSIPLACGGWAETKAAYRLLDNPAVEWREILEVHTTRTVERMAGQPVVLCIQDTTELDFTTQPGIAGLGRLSYEAQHGLYAHPTLVVTPAGLALGVLDAWLWARKPKDQPNVKESTRWVEGYEIVADLAETVPDTRLVYVADREGDLRALIDAAARRGTPADWLIRSKHDRKTTTGEKLWDRLARSEPAGGGRIHPAGGAGSSRPVGAADAVSHRGDAAGASRPTGGDRDRAPGPGRTAPGRAAGAGVAAADQPAGGNAGGGGTTHRLVSKTLADRNFFPNLESRAAGSRRCNWAPWSAWSGPW
jgi:hypothetical protein